MPRSLAVLILAFCLACACTPPGAYEKFVPASEAEENIYIFDVDLSDTTCLYDVSFYTKVDTPLAKPKEMKSFKMDIFWVSPSDRRYEEIVYYPSWETRVPYRRGVEVSEGGEWRLAIQISDPPAGLRGLGVIFKRAER